MTNFQKIILVNEIEKDWILEEFKNLQFDCEWDNEYNFNDEQNTKYLDTYFLNELADQYEDLEIKDKFYKWVKIRDFWLSKLMVYQKLYKPLKFDIDAFPNFTVKINSTNLPDKYEIKFSPDYYKHENTHNPFFLALFLQKFLMRFHSSKIIKFSFIEEYKTAGVLTVDAEKIKLKHVDQIKDDFKILTKYDIRPQEKSFKVIPCNENPPHCVEDDPNEDHFKLIVKDIFTKHGIY